jgi:hypothetical protein
MQHRLLGYFLGSAFIFALIPSLANAQTAQKPCPVCTAVSPGFDKDSGLTVVPASAENIALDKADGVTSISFIDKRQMFTVTAQLQNRPKPTKAADLAVVRSIEKYTLTAHPGAKMPLNEIGIFELGQREYPAYGKVFTWPVSGGMLSSIMWIVPHKKRYLILRTEFIDTQNILDKTFEAIEKAAEVQTSVASQICEAR